MIPGLKIDNYTSEGSIAFSISVPITNQTCQKFPTDIVQKIVVPPDRYKFYCLLRTQKRLSSFSSLFIFVLKLFWLSAIFKSPEVMFDKESKACG